MRYEQRGQIPHKRHTVFRDNGTLLTEEVMGYEGFSGNESILYHLISPCRVKEIGSFEPIKREEWVPDAHAHRHMKTSGIDEQGGGSGSSVPSGTAFALPAPQRATARFSAVSRRC